MHGVGIGQCGETLAVQALDDDLVPVVFLVHHECQGHPACVVGDRGTIRRKEFEGAAEAVFISRTKTTCSPALANAVRLVMRPTSSTSKWCVSSWAMIHIVPWAGH